MKGVKLKQGAFVVVCGLVFYAMSRGTPPAMLFEHSDKVGHVFALFMLSLTARLVIYRCSAYGFWWVMFVLAYMLEYLQGEWLPLRVFSMGDVLANMVGVAAALMCLIVFRRPV